jgi:hypothetical protein
MARETQLIHELAGVEVYYVGLVPMTVNACWLERHQGCFTVSSWSPVWQVIRGQRNPWSLNIKKETDDPEASVSLDNLERIDASREWLSVVLRILDFVRAPHLDKTAKLLEAVRYAVLEKALRLEGGVLILREHVGGQEEYIAPACRCAFRRGRLG